MFFVSLAGVDAAVIPLSRALSYQNTAKCNLVPGLSSLFGGPSSPTVSFLSFSPAPPPTLLRSLSRVVLCHTFPSRRRWNLNGFRDSLSSPVSFTAALTNPSFPGSFNSQSNERNSSVKLSFLVLFSISFSSLSFFRSSSAEGSSLGPDISRGCGALLTDSFGLCVEKLVGTRGLCHGCCGVGEYSCSDTPPFLPPSYC